VVGWQSKKAATQQLMSGEFDPINDFDSNYGRVLGTPQTSSLLISALR